MKKNKLIIIILIIAVLLMISGCGKSEGVDNLKGLSNLPSTTPEIVPTTAPTLTPEELSMEAYERFMRNEVKVYE